MEAARLPAEWEPHTATLLAWPHQSRDWPGKFSAIPWVFAEIVRHITPDEPVYLAVQNQRHEASARRTLEKTGVALERVRFMRIPLDRGWMRDCAPFFLKRGEGLEALGLRFNGWARYDNHHQDAAYGRALCSALGLPFAVAEYKGVQPVLEGGAVESNGAGTLMVTEECLLSEQVQVRNPGWTRTDYEKFFHVAFGAERILWLGKGIAGDDTHGHIDDLCRFVSNNCAVLCREKNPRDVNYHHLEENWERMQGADLELIELPMPAPLCFDKVRLPASYANFYVTNGAVLAPTFNDPADRVALGLLAECFPGRRVIGIHAVDLIWGFGAVHCLSHELPA